MLEEPYLYEINIDDGTGRSKDVDEGVHHQSKECCCCIIVGAIV